MKKQTKIKTEPQQNLMEVIEKISEKTMGSKLKATNNEELSAYLKSLSDFLDVSTVQAILFTGILSLNFRKKRVSLDALANFLGISGIQLLKYMPDLKVLESRKWIRTDREGSRKNALVYDIGYFVTRGVTDQIMNNQSNQLPEKFENIYQLLSSLATLTEDFERGRISYFDMVDEIMGFLEANRNLHYVKRLITSGFSREEKLLFMLVCQHHISGEPECDLDRMTGIACGTSIKRIDMKRELIHGKSRLISTGMLKLEEGIFMQDKQIIVTNHALKVYFPEDIGLLERPDINDSYLTRFDSIVPRTLYFEREEEKHLFRLQKLISPKGYNEVAEQLTSKSMNKGFTILLHGAPGTGKTEAVLQLARRTRRDIMKVDLSQSKSMWFGESEKRIKGIFDRYAGLQKSMKQTPVLFFNEADAIFGLRSDLSQSSSMQTFNAMQNILLDEMERFEGILIATTNLTTNFDRAFERRFLFKIALNCPSEATRKKILRSKLPELSSKQIAILAENYELSGGQIDNIARKYQIDQLLNGRKPGIADLHAYCREEKILKKDVARIGYKN